MVYVGKLVKYMWNVEHREKNICQSQVEEKIIDGNPVELQELLIINRPGLEIAQRISVCQSQAKDWEKSSGILWNKPLSIY